jgi:hypothetical protein
MLRVGVKVGLQTFWVKLIHEMTIVEDIQNRFTVKKCLI